MWAFESTIKVIFMNKRMWRHIKPKWQSIFTFLSTAGAVYQNDKMLISKAGLR